MTLQHMIVAVGLSGASLVAGACSFIPPAEFEVIAAGAAAQAELEPIAVLSTRFEPRIGGETSCEGFGSMELLFSLPESLRSGAVALGYELKMVSGAHGAVVVPGYPIASSVRPDGADVIGWHWYGAVPDEDGHYRWQVEVTAVTREGRRTRPVPICLATDASC